MIDWRESIYPSFSSGTNLNLHDWFNNTSALLAQHLPSIHQPPPASTFPLLLFLDHPINYKKQISTKKMASLNTPVTGEVKETIKKSETPPSPHSLAKFQQSSKLTSNSLFNTKKYSDLGIYCRGKFWDVHQAIVCMRSTVLETFCTKSGRVGVSISPALLTYDQILIL